MTRCAIVGFVLVIGAGCGGDASESTTGADADQERLKKQHALAKQARADFTALSVDPDAAANLAWTKATELAVEGETAAAAVAYEMAADLYRAGAKRVRSNQATAADNARVEALSVDLAMLKMKGEDLVARASKIRTETAGDTDAARKRMLAIAAGLDEMVATAEFRRWQSTLSVLETQIRSRQFDAARAGLTKAQEAHETFADEVNALGPRFDATLAFTGAKQKLQDAAGWYRRAGLDSTAALGPVQAKMQRAHELRSARNYGEAIPIYKQVAEEAAAARRNGDTLLGHKKAAMRVRASAAASAETWNLVQRTLDAVTRDEASAGLAALARGDALLKEHKYKPANDAFADAALRLDEVVRKHSGRAPLGWRILDPAKGWNGYCRAVADPQSGIRFLLVEPGTFDMGVLSGTPAKGEFVKHKVTLTRGYYLAQYETTTGQWFRFVGATGHVSRAEERGRSQTWEKASLRVEAMRDACWMEPYPGWELVAQATWPVTALDARDVDRFCRHYGYRLPTEAEFEYAARAGQKTRYAWGNNPKDGRGQGNFFDRTADNSLRSYVKDSFFFRDEHRFVAPVGSFPANAWGFFDLDSNVRERVADRFGAKTSAKARTDPLHTQGQDGVWRGGSYMAGATTARIAARGPLADKALETWTGFRVVRVIE